MRARPGLSTVRWMDTRTRQHRSATELAALVRAGHLTARAAVEDCLARIADLDGGIGAFQAVDASAARHAADEVDRRPDLADLPLAGVPVAVKDNIAVAGL